jgi:hypothetical protein
MVVGSSAGGQVGICRAVSKAISAIDYPIAMCSFGWNQHDLAPQSS